MYLGRSAEAIECLQFAQSLSPDDPLSYFCSIGTGAANFEIGRCAEAARWFGRLRSIRRPCGSIVISPRRSP